MLDKQIEQLEKAIVEAQSVSKTPAELAKWLIDHGYVNAKSFAEGVGSRIAGHSDYHGDDILSALYCAAEGEISDKSIVAIDTYAIYQKGKKQAEKEILQAWSNDVKGMGVDNNYVKLIAQQRGVQIDD
ncbi:MAG: hypothetical protein NC218_01760 [Acetobacter sp.]|nr:hypothetical protein [Acetobacter sp.]